LACRLELDEPMVSRYEGMAAHRLWTNHQHELLLLDADYAYRVHLADVIELVEGREARCGA